MKSLFIVSVPRSASTTLEKTCATGLRSLGFAGKGEVLNAGHVCKLRVPQYAKKEEHFKKLRKRCSKFVELRIIRDVIQTHFIVQNFEWLKDRFNMIFLLRPVDEIMVSRKRLGWKMPKKAVIRYQNMLKDIPEQESYKHLDYYDFIQNNPNKLIKILQNWYPDCHSFNYMTSAFINKRNSTFKSIRLAEAENLKKKKKKS